VRLAHLRSLQYNGVMDTYVPRLHRVYLVDDHDIVRRGLLDLLVHATDIDVVGDSGSAQEAVPEILRLDADVMLLDLQLQDGSGIEICRAVRSARPSVSGLLLTASGDDEALAAAVLAGAAGYLVKQSRASDIAGAIRRIRPGRSLLDPDSVRRAAWLLHFLMDALTPQVTEDERRVLDQILDGLRSGRIVEAPATDQPGSGEEVEHLVARLTYALLGPGSGPTVPGTGRHRRPD